MKTIAYLVSDLHAPSHTFVRREIAALERRGVDIAAYSVHAEPARKDRRTILGHGILTYVAAVFATIIQSPLALWSAWMLSLRHRPKGMKALIWSQFHLLEAIYLARQLRHDQCAHLHSHFANSGATVGLLASRLAGIGWSLTLHGISETDFPAIATLPDKLARASFVACASRFMMAQGMRLVDRRHWPKFRLIRCGIQMDAMPDMPSAKGGLTLRMVCVGRLSAEKGYYGLLDALRQVGTDVRAFRVSIVGDGPERDRLRSAIDQAALPVEIELLGALPEHDTLKVVAACDFLVLPSLMEGLPVVLMEARALGKPVIASALAGIPELVSHGETGLLFEPTHWSQLAKAITTMVSDDAARMEMARRASESFPAEFDIDVVAERLADEFANVVSRDAYS